MSTPVLTLGDATTDAGVLAASSGPVSIQTGSLVVGTAGGTISAGSSGTIEFAPDTAGDLVVLGTGGAGTLAIDPSATGLTLTYGTLRLGAVNGTTVAGSIAVAAGAGAYTIPGTLDLEATGGVTQSTGLTATELTGTVGSVTLTNASNTDHDDRRSDGNRRVQPGQQGRRDDRRCAERQCGHRGHRR